MSGSYNTLLAGRADSTTGPAPFPTNYWAYTLGFEILPGFGQGVKGLWNNTACGYHYKYNQRAFVRSPTTNRPGVKTLAATFNGKGVTAYLPDVSQQTIDLSVSRAFKSMNELNLGQAIAELPEMVFALADLIKRVIKAFIAIRKGQYRLAAKLLGLTSIPDLASHYLSWVWGYAPFLDAINNGAQALKKALEVPDLVTVKGLATTEYPLGILSPSWYYSGNLLLGASTQLSYKLNDAMATALDRVGLQNVIGLVWELVPLSFIINWFYSIGDFLNQLSFGAGLSYSHGHTTTFTRGKFTAKNYEGELSYQRNIKPCIWNYDFNLMHRKLLIASPKPSLHFKWSLDSGKSLGILALLTQL